MDPRFRGDDNTPMKKLAIFVSGNGTNMENLIVESFNGRIPAQIGFVLTDNPQAGAIAKAENYGARVEIVDRKAFKTKTEFETAIIKQLEISPVDYIVLAGFMRILSPEFVRKYKGKIINIHPSLLPVFPGAHSIRDAFEAKVQETGVTVHFVDEGIDSGQIILQKKISVAPEETLETLEAKIHAVEYEIYPEALRKVLKREVKFSG